MRTPAGMEHLNMYVCIYIYIYIYISILGKKRHLDVVGLEDGDDTRAGLAHVRVQQRRPPLSKTVHIRQSRPY